MSESIESVIAMGDLTDTTLLKALDGLRPVHGGVGRYPGVGRPAAAWTPAQAATEAAAAAAQAAAEAAAWAGTAIRGASAAAQDAQDAQYRRLCAYLEGSPIPPVEPLYGKEEQ